MYNHRNFVYKHANVANFVINYALQVLYPILSSSIAQVYKFAIALRISIQAHSFFFFSVFLLSFFFFLFFEMLKKLGRR